MTRILYVDDVDIKMATDPVYSADADPCYMCGKPVKNPKHDVEIIGGGDIILIERGDYDEEQDAGYMGCYVVGPDCYRKVQKAAKESGRDVDAETLY